uniref:Glucuronosyltransferase n=1 Tax=Ascaris lumbricoides TaxID=6252 RepID=A0A0M3IP85_ASCLU
MDFGMGLELGHNLFLSNFSDFDKLAVSILNGAYTLLGRDEFSRILKAHAEIRRSFDNKEATSILENIKGVILSKCSISPVP